MAIYIFLFWVILSDGHEQKFNQQTCKCQIEIHFWTYISVSVCFFSNFRLILKEELSPNQDSLTSFLFWSDQLSHTPSLNTSHQSHPHPQPPRKSIPIASNWRFPPRSASTLAVHFRQVLQHLPRSMEFFNAPIFSAEKGGGHGSSGKKTTLETMRQSWDVWFLINSPKNP